VAVLRICLVLFAVTLTGTVSGCIPLLITAVRPIGVSRERVPIVGEFGPGRSCRIHVGTDTSTATDLVGQTRHNPRTQGYAVGPSGYVSRGVNCAGGGRSFLVLFLARESGQSPTGVYEALRDLKAMVRDSSKVEMKALVQYEDHARFGFGTPGSGFMRVTGNIHLTGVSGTITFSRLALDDVVGRVQLIAVREWGPNG